MLRRIAMLANFTSKPSVPAPPINPNMYESFATKISKKDLEKFMNPMGFLSEAELEEYKKESSITTGQTNLPPEVGFKVKGLEPTRYGDWERNGRVSDF